MSQEEQESPAELARQLQEATLAYERLAAQIVELMAKYEGQSENMPQSAHDRYRALAAKRDEAYYQMKTMERLLFDDV